MYILEQVAAAFVFSCRLERRDKIKIRYFAAAGILLLLGVMMSRIVDRIVIQANAADLAAGEYFSWHALVYSLGIVAVMTGIILYTRRVSLMEAVYAETCAYLTEHIAYCIRILCNSLFGSPVADGVEDVLYWVIHVAVYLAAYYLFAKNMIRKGHYYAAPKRTIALLVYALAIILIISLYASTYKFEKLHAIYAIAFSVYVLVSQIDRQKQLAEQEEGTIRQLLMVAQREQYDLYRQNVSTVDRKCHDLRHQAGHLLNSAADEAQREEIKSLMRDIMIYDSFVRTGNRNLDTILNQKNEACTGKHIELTCVADGRSLNFLDPVDLFAVFDRMLDKAMTEVGRLPENERRIHLTVSDKLGMIIVAVEYPSVGANTGKSSQEREQFLRAMELTVEKYDGSVQITEEDNTVVRIVLQEP